MVKIGRSITASNALEDFPVVRSSQRVNSEGSTGLTAEFLLLQLLSAGAAGAAMFSFATFSQLATDPHRVRNTVRWDCSNCTERPGFLRGPSPPLCLQFDATNRAFVIQNINSLCATARRATAREVAIAWQATAS